MWGSHTMDIISPECFQKKAVGWIGGNKTTTLAIFFAKHPAPSDVLCTQHSTLNVNQMHKQDYLSTDCMDEGRSTEILKVKKRRGKARSDFYCTNEQLDS